MSDPRLPPVRRLLGGGRVSWLELDELRAELAVALLGGHGMEAAETAGIEADRLAAILDLCQALELVEDDEPAFAWNRAGLLRSAGRHEEAAAAFLSAAAKLRAGIEAGWLTDADAEEWGEAAKAYACRSLAQAGRYVSAALVWRSLADADYRTGLREILDGWDGREPPPGLEELPGWIPHPHWK